MSNGCKHGSCSLPEGSSHHSHSPCACGSQANQGCSSTCPCPCHQTCGCCACQGEQQAKRLLALADEAWMEVVKERIKELIIQHDPKIDEIAQVVAEANRHRWHSKIEKHLNKEEYIERLEALMHRHEQPRKKR